MTASNVSIIITALDEPYLRQTVDTLLQRTPFELIDKILIIDDCSATPIDLAYPKVQIIRNSERQGLIKARDDAISACSSPYIVSLDAHVKISDGWLPPLLDKLSDGCSIVVPMTVGLDPLSWSETGRKQGKTGWRWDLDFFWCRDDGTDETPAFAGHCFGLSKEWYHKVGGFDTKMNQWGCENIEFSLRTWLCGGYISLARDSTVAHWFKRKFEYDVSYKELLHNKARVAEVWFDEHKRFFYQAIGSRNIDFGDIVTRLSSRYREQTKHFKWFVEKFQPNLSGIDTLQNKHAKAAVAILGAGPSLDNLSLSTLDKFDVVIGVNYTGSAFDCDYIIYHDYEPVLDMVVNSVRAYDKSRLLVPRRLKDGSPDGVSPHDVSNRLTIYDLGAIDDGGSLQHKTPPFFHHASTAHTAAHFAVFLGAKSVTLFGCDVKFAADGRSHTKMVPQYRGGYYWPKNKSTEEYLGRVEKGWAMLGQVFNRWNISLVRTENV